MPLFKNDKYILLIRLNSREGYQFNSRILKTIIVKGIFLDLGSNAEFQD
jgi:hypothetical protein